MNTAQLEARQVSKIFGVLPVLRCIDLRVNRGEGALIVGRNGSGKSTLMRILAGLSRPSSGQALLFGEPAHSLGPQQRCRISLVSHRSFLYPRLTARENLEFYARLYRVTDYQYVVEKLLDRVGLGSFADEPVFAFSRGMEQRLTIARSMMTEPEVLVMDEPFAALDAEGIDIAAELVRDALQRGCAVVMTAHDPHQLRHLAFISYSLENGRLVMAHFGSDSEGRKPRPAAAG